MSDTPLTIVRPSADPKGAIVVLQEAFGVNDHIVDLGARLAAAGWLAVIPHLFHRTGDPALGYDDLAEIFPHIQAMTAEGAAADIDAAIAAAGEEGLPPSSCGVVGFCMGGSLSFLTATRHQLGAAVTFYGGGIRGRWFMPSQLDTAPNLKAPWLGLYGDQDEGIPIDDVEALRVATATATVPTEIVRYPDADHGFNCDRRDSYHAPSAADAWSRMLAWFDQHITTS